MLFEKVFPSEYLGEILHVPLPFRPVIKPDFQYLFSLQSSENFAIQSTFKITIQGDIGKTGFHCWNTMRNIGGYRLFGLHSSSKFFFPFSVIFFVLFDHFFHV